MILFSVILLDYSICHLAGKHLSLIPFKSYSADSAADHTL